MVGKTCNLPTSCPCGSKFDIQHSLSCKKGLIYTWHNNLRDLTASMMSEVRKDTEIQLKLTPLSGEKLKDRMSNNSNKARIDIRARGFWARRQQAFYDLWVFDPNASRYCSKSLQQCYVVNEQEKKRAYNERILQIDHGTFTHLRECQKFYLLLAQTNLKREIFHNQLQVIGFEQKFALGW